VETCAWCIDESAGGLSPRLNPPRPGQEVPAKNHRSQADAGKRAAAHLQSAGEGLPVLIRAGIALRMRRGRIALPKRHDVTGKLELAAENARMKDRRQHLAQLIAGGEKLVLRAISDAEAAVDKKAVLPAPVLAHLRDGIIILHPQTWPRNHRKIFVSCCNLRSL